MSNKKVRIFVFPWISNESFIILMLGILLLPLIIYAGVSAFLEKTVGHLFEPIASAYWTFAIAPIIYFVKPEAFPTGFGTKVLSEDEIQKFYDSSIRNSFYSGSSNQYIYMNIIFAIAILILILFFYYKNGVVKGKIRWVGRYIVLNIFITIPIWYYAIKKYEYWINNRYNLAGHYTEIYKTLQKYVTDSYLIFLALAFVMTLIGHALILVVGRNKAERDRKREANKILKQQKVQQKLNKVKEYY